MESLAARYEGSASHAAKALKSRLEGNQLRIFPRYLSKVIELLEIAHLDFRSQGFPPTNPRESRHPVSEAYVAYALVMDSYESVTSQRPSSPSEEEQVVRDLIHWTNTIRSDMVITPQTKQRYEDLKKFLREIAERGIRDRSTMDLNGRPEYLII